MYTAQARQVSTIRSRQSAPLPLCREGKVLIWPPNLIVGCSLSQIRLQEVHSSTPVPRAGDRLCGTTRRSCPLFLRLRLRPSHRDCEVCQSLCHCLCACPIISLSCLIIHTPLCSLPSLNWFLWLLSARETIVFHSSPQTSDCCFPISLSLTCLFHLITPLSCLFIHTSLCLCSLPSLNWFLWLFSARETIVFHSSPQTSDCCFPISCLFHLITPLVLHPLSLSLSP